MSVFPLQYAGTESSPSIVRLIPVAQETKSTERQTIRVVLEQGQDGWFVVSSPDLESLVTQGKTEEQAERKAVDAIELILEELGQEKEFNLIVTRKF